jgi:hypothetical protein
MRHEKKLKSQKLKVKKEGSKKLNRITGRTRVPLASLWVNCATNDEKDYCGLVSIINLSSYNSVYS